jgi:hypothetical protein
MRVLDWRVLAASGVAAADGGNGYHNPTTGTFAGAQDTINGGELPNMSGKHVALLDGGSAGNHFLSSSRKSAAASTTYTLTAALGVRDNPASYGNARLEITSNGPAACLRKPPSIHSKAVIAPALLRTHRSHG